MVGRILCDTGLSAIFDVSETHLVSTHDSMYEVIGHVKLIANINSVTNDYLSI